MNSDFAGVLAITAYKRAGEAIYQGIQNAREEGHELTELQQLILWAALLQSVDGITADFKSLIETETALTDTGRWLA